MNQNKNLEIRDDEKIKILGKKRIDKVNKNEKSHRVSIRYVGTDEKILLNLSNVVYGLFLAKDRTIVTHPESVHDTGSRRCS